MPEHTDPNDNSRSQLILFLLFSSAFFAFCYLFLCTALVIFTESAISRRELVTIFICTVILLAAIPVVGFTNRRFSPFLSGSLYLFFLFSAVTFCYIYSDPPHTSSSFWFSIPIACAGYVLFPAAGFLVSLLSSLLIILTALIRQHQPDIMTCTGFFVIATISFFAAESLKKVTARSLRLTAQLREKMNEQTRSNAADLNRAEARGRFISRMAHDIRTPMSAILGISRYLTEHHAENLTLDQKDGLIMIFRSCKKLLLISNEVTELLRLDSGKQKAHLNLFSLEDLIKELKENVNDLIDQKNVIVYFQVDSHIREKIQTDRNKLSQIIIGFIGNLIKPVSEEEINIHVHETSGTLRFDIQFHNKKITETHLKFLTEDNRVLAEEDMDEYSRQGIGFNLCRELVALLRGKILVETGESSTLVCFSFPMDPS